MISFSAILSIYTIVSRRDMRSPNQTFHNIASTLSYMYWTSRLEMDESDKIDFANFLSYIECTYIKFDKYCMEVASFKFRKNIVFMRVMGRGNVIYLCNLDTLVTVPLLMFEERHGVIENTISVCSLSNPIPDRSLLEIYQVN